MILKAHIPISQKMIGAKNIPESWKNNVTGILRTGVSGFYQVSIEELTRRTCAIIDKK